MPLPPLRRLSVAPPQPFRLHMHLAILLAVLPLALCASPEVPLREGTIVRFASVEEGREVLALRDDFTNRLGPLELQIRLATDKPVTADDYLQHVVAQVIPWSEEQTKMLTGVIAALGAKLDGLHFVLPPTVLLIQTTGKDEADAAYTRGAAIVLPQSKLRGRVSELERLLAHELFHVLSRHNAQQRQRLYAIIGFTPCGEIPLPDAIAARRITNPDGPRIDYAIRVKHRGEEISAAPVLLASVERFDMERRPTLFQVWQLKLLALEQHEGTWRPLMRDGAPVLLDARTNASYRAQIGGNTDYIIHPDEIVADNFAHLVLRAKNVQSPRIVEEMCRVFTP